MNRVICLLVVFLFIVGCAVQIPLTGRLDYSNLADLQASPRHPAKIALFIDKKMRETVFTQGPSGFVGSATQAMIPLGSAIANSLIEALSFSFSDLRILPSPVAPEGYTLLDIKAEKMRVSFQYSAYPFVMEGAMDQAQIFLLLNTFIRNPKEGKSKQILSKFAEEEIENNIPPLSKAGVIERCISRIAIQYAKDIKSAIPIPPADR
jgi:hypothetical protein